LGATPPLCHCRAKAANSIALGSGFAPFRANRAPFVRSVIPTKVGIPSLPNACGVAPIPSPENTIQMEQKHGEF